MLARRETASWWWTATFPSEQCRTPHPRHRGWRHGPVGSPRRVESTGCRGSRDTVRLRPVTITGEPRPAGKSPRHRTESYDPRHRHPRDAAAAAVCEVREGSGGRLRRAPRAVTAIGVGRRRRPPRHERARSSSAPDGSNSKVAELSTRSSTEQTDAAAGRLLLLWSNSGEGMEGHPPARPRVRRLPTHHGESRWWSGGPYDEHAATSRTSRATPRRLELSPAFAERMRGPGARIVLRHARAELLTTRRTERMGPVADAGYTKDPITAPGHRAEAFRQRRGGRPRHRRVLTGSQSATKAFGAYQSGATSTPAPSTSSRANSHLAPHHPRCPLIGDARQTRTPWTTS